ncbi:hypothetical protein OB69_08805 [Roseivirga seohaensis subsp. aquiponti]|uniref:Preprotein translocase subunit SecB n=1 Tax=Roseivirga seohaensis subsp. aquiponti TaxID=1566026 RepID=A0A0L8AL03_9BACT|nr:protein-export chaperone SecB [Roseivirga seohaensis]KOF02931.1 hypothetical protein OB69_08805 [Roseivirga seohaensis subsp. aquiponti]
MKANVSPLKLLNFYMLENHFRFEEPEKDVKNVLELFDKYEIEIDFSHFTLENDFFEAHVKVQVNADQKHKGYVLAASGYGVFKLYEHSEMEEGVKDNLKGFSSVSIGINCIRNLFSTSTANAPMGRYILPAIDIQSLFRDKEGQQTKAS